MTEKKVTKKKKILLLSDDMRLFSGIATMSRALVLGTVDKYDWIQVAAAMRPQGPTNQLIDVSKDIQEKTGVKDANVKLFPIEGYGNADLVRNIISVEKPDALLHFTDPRFWIWLYQMEAEIRSHIPITYLNIWDDLPFPHYNKPYYESCDLLMSISRQTYSINKHVLGHGLYKEIDKLKPNERLEHKSLISYVPHGIDRKEYYPLSTKDKQDTNGAYHKIKSKLFGKRNFDFIVLFNNRNIRRKNPADIILAFKTFCDTLSKEKSSRCMLLMHTEPIDPNGTDLYAVANVISPMYPVMFSSKKLSIPELNVLYNIADVTINMSSNEGFGLTTAESLMAGTPIIANTTGGLQDQMGFKKENGDYVGIHDLTEEWSSNHNGRFKDHGEWAFPVYPTNRSIQGSPATPYIFDDRCSYEDVAARFTEVYSLSKSERTKRGLAGRKYMLNEGFNNKSMCDMLSKSLDNTIERFDKRKRYHILNTLIKSEVPSTAVAETIT